MKNGKGHPPHARILTLLEEHQDDLQEAAFEQAHLLLSVVDFHTAPSPQIDITREGGAQLSWTHDGRTLEINISHEGSLSYVAVQGETMVDGDANEVADLLPLITWLVIGTPL